MKNYCIYKIICPITDNPVYIGYSKNFRRRRREHRCYTEKTMIPDMDKWKLLLKSKGLRCELEILESNIENIKLAKEKEIEWVKKLREEGYALFNLSPGGDLVYLLDSHISNKIRGKSLEDIYGIKKGYKIREALSKATKGENNPNFQGKYCTPKWSEKQSISNSKTPIVVTDINGEFIGEFINSKECAKFLGIGHSLVRECKSKGWLARHKYKIKNKT